MTDQSRLSCLTTFLYGLAAVTFAGTLLELLAARHHERPAQLIPFLLCLAGLGAVLMGWKRPDRVTIIGLRLLMVVTASGALLGVWKHLESNMVSIAERNPGIEGFLLLTSALSGRAPLLASGVMAAAASLAVAATFAAGWDRSAMQVQPSDPTPRGALAMTTSRAEPAASRTF